MKVSYGGMSLCMSRREKGLPDDVSACLKFCQTRSPFREKQNFQGMEKWNIIFSLKFSHEIIFTEDVSDDSSETISLDI